jgi:cytochrome P450
MRHLDVYERLQQEVDEYYEKSVPDGSEITYQQCLTLPYLQAVVKEAGRVFPSIMYQIPRIVPAEGITIAGYVLPPGTNAGISARSMNRDKKIFGDDANEFRPDRWLEDESRARYMDSLLATVLQPPQSPLSSKLTVCSLDTVAERVLGKTLHWWR